jgi:hypothetical protein
MGITFWLAKIVGLQEIGWLLVVVFTVIEKILGG